MKLKKIFWAAVAVAFFASGAPFLSSPNTKAQEVNFSPLKKTKKNYRSLSAFSVSGNGSDSDASIISTSSLAYFTNLYRKVPIPGLSMSDPFPFRIFKKSASKEGFEEENWGGMTNYFITDGYLWFYYGYNYTYGGQATYNDFSTGDYRYFNYFGGTKAKRRKRQAVKTYSLTASGDENDADASGIPYVSEPATVYYYRKLAIPELKMDNFVDYRVYRKNSFYQGFSDESWYAVSSNYFVTDGYIYVAYGRKSTDSGSTFTSLNNGDYRIFIYSDGKKKKKKLTRQYTKRYAFNVPGGEDTADKISTTTNSYGYTTKLYYKKFTMPEAKMANFPNARVVKKNSFPASLPSDSWSQGSYYVIDGYLWINYGLETISPSGTSTYYDIGPGDYRVFLYK